MTYSASRWTRPVRRAWPLCGLSLLSAFWLCSCMTFQPTHRHEIRWVIHGSHDQFQTATRNASERMGGTIIERPIFTPRSAEMVDSSRRDQSSIYVGFMTPIAGTVLDSILLKSEGDSGLVTIRGFYPVLTGAAIQEELDYPRTMTSISERRATMPAMSVKSRFLFTALSLFSPAVGNTYLLIGNPFANDSPELVNILVPMAIDAGLIYFWMKERNDRVKAGIAVLGVGAIYMRLSGILGLSAEIDRYNTIARSGYSMSKEDLQMFKSQLTLEYLLP